MSKPLKTSVLLALAPLIASAKTIDEIIDVVVQEIIDPIKYLLIIAAIVLFLYGIIEMIAGAANEDSRTKGKTHIMWGLVGLVIILSVSSIISILENFFNSV